MIISVCGYDFQKNMGNLKTYTMTAILYDKYKKGFKIYANYKLNFDYEPINSFKSLLELFKSRKNIVIAIDEFHIYFDQYTRPSKKNGTYFLKELARQTRKRNIIFIFTNQSFLDTNISIRRLITYALFTSKLHINGKICKDDTCKKNHILRIDYDDKTKFYKVNKKIFELYDSSEIIDIEI